MKRVLTAAAASVVLALALVLPVAAAGPGFSGFGAATASLTREWFPFGQTLSGYARQALVSTIVAGEHADPAFCVQH